MAAPRLDDVHAALRARGLEPRGAFHATPDDAVPPLADGRAAATVVLAGQIGASHWAAFARDCADELASGARDPLDRWSARMLGDVAHAFGAAVILPSDGPPYAPFQRWAERAEPVHPSPLGLRIHPDAGLWHAYRGALLFAERLRLPPRDARTSPCDACAEQPCLRACPVDAFAAGGLDAARCAAHLATPAGEPCFEAGCLARAACPVGRRFAYPPAAARFHLAAFLRAQRGT